MARWPSYLALVWQDLKPAVDSEPYARIRQQLHDEAMAAAEGLPYRYMLDQARAIAVGMTEDQVAELQQVITLFQWLISGLVLNVTWFKQAMQEG